MSRQVRRVVAVYVLAALAWIVVSTPLADAIARATPVRAATLELGKGIAFVVVTGGLLALVLERSYRSLVDSERRFHTLADAVQEGLYVQRLHPQRRFEFVNPALEATTGLPAAAFHRDASVTRRHIHPDDVAAVEAALQDPSSVESPLLFRWHRPDGAWRWLEARETPVHDRSGRLVAVQGVAVDVTAREEREAALASALEQERQAAAELEELQERQRAFLQAVSHDLRTPLTAILGIAETLAQRGDSLDPAERMHLRTRLHGNAQRLSGLLTDLLDVDRLSRRVIEPQRHDVDLSGLVRDTVAHLDTSRHEVVLPEVPLVTSADPAQVGRIVENLVANALKHTPPGTRITVACRPVEDGAELVVEDAGPGVDGDAGQRIFEPFERATAPDDPSPGSGIGLSLVRGFARLHGGDAWFERADGGGARFVVRLPTETRPESQPAG